MLTDGMPGCRNNSPSPRQARHTTTKPCGLRRRGQNTGAAAGGSEGGDDQVPSLGVAARRTRRVVCGGMGGAHVGAPLRTYVLTTRVAGNGAGVN